MFKKCSACTRVWRTHEDFLKGTEAKGSMMGLNLYNCPCGTTIGIESYPGSVQDFVSKLKEKNGNGQTEKTAAPSRG